jgi:proteasome lid subunit RPN8/RPN11
MLQITQSACDRLRQESETAYPGEACGILLGERNDAAGGDGAQGTGSQKTDAQRIVTHAIPVPNASSRPHRHYEIGPRDLIRIEKFARQAGQEILGFYHSHPDHPAQPSPTDLGEAHWLGFSYLITSVLQGHAAESRSFYLAGTREEDKHFQAEELQILVEKPVEQLVEKPAG